MRSKKICFVINNIEDIKSNKDLVTYLDTQNIDLSFLIPSELKGYCDFNQASKFHIIEELTQDIPYYLQYNFSSKYEYLSYQIYKALESICLQENYDLIVFGSNITDASISIQAKKTLGKFEKTTLIIDVDKCKNLDTRDFNLLAKHRIIYLKEFALKNADYVFSFNDKDLNCCSDIIKNKLSISDNQDFLKLFSFENKPFIKYNSINAVPKVSAIATFYNAHDYFEETLASLEKNTYPDFEIIIVNDGSTEKKSIELLEKLEKLNKYKIINKSNGGPASARNAGVIQADGEYVLYLDADDRISPDYIEKGVNCLINNPESPFVVSYCNNVAENGKDLIYSCPIYPNYPVLIAIGGTSYSAVYRKSLFDKFRFDENLLRTDDWEFYVNLSANGYIGIAIPEFLFDYRRRDASISSNFEPGEKTSDLVYFRKKHEKFFEKLGLRPEEIDINKYNVADIVAMSSFKKMLEEFIDKNRDKKICFYGAGQFARAILGQYDLSMLNIAGFIDMSTHKIGQKLGNYPICSVDDIEKIKPDVIAITVVQKQYVIPYLENIKSSKKLEFNIAADFA